MVFPFQLFCKGCGAKIFSVTAEGEVADLLELLQEDSNVDSWLSRKLRGRAILCPDCGRKMSADPLVRAEVIFSEWETTGQQNVSATSVAFYV